MSDLVGNPEDRFSRVAAHIYYAGYMLTAIADTKPIMYVLLKDKKRQRLVLNHD